MIEPLLPRPKRRHVHFPGRKPIDDRKVMAALIFILKTGTPWKMMPTELECGAANTLRSRLAYWARSGVFEKLHALLLQRLNVSGMLHLRRVIVDASFVKAPKGGEGTGPSPVDRRKIGSKHHVLTDSMGTPLVVITTQANRNEITQLLPLIDALKPIRGRVGRPRQHPEYLQGDEAYASIPHQRELKKRGIKPVIAQRRRGHGSGLGSTRWPVERTNSWLHAKIKIGLRRDRSLLIHNAFVALACSLICYQELHHNQSARHF